jgi:DNA-binding transcriptional ArsR family regulator
MFGLGRPRALDRNAKVRIMHWARCLSRRTEKGRAYGVVTAKALAVLEALLWSFHNAKSGVCFPSYEKIAEAAGCARSTVAESLKALEDAGIRSARRQRMALARAQDVKRLRLHRSFACHRPADFFQVRKADWNTESRIFSPQ